MKNAKVGTSGGTNVTSSEAAFVASAEFHQGREWEENAKQILEDIGYTVIRNRELPDLLVTDKTRAVWVECKSKARMKQHPATGFNQRNYDSYVLAERLLGRPVIVAFKEPAENVTYGNTLDVLEQHIYGKDWGVVTFQYPEAFVSLDRPSNWQWLIEEALEA